MAGELGVGSVFTGEPGEGGVGVSEWWPAPMNNAPGWLEDTAAAVDTSDGESSMSDCSEVSHTQVSQSGKEAVSGYLPLSCRRAVVTLLPKKGNLQDFRKTGALCLSCVWSLCPRLFTELNTISSGR